MTTLSDRPLPVRSGIGEPDFGTPARTSERMLSVTIDGIPHAVIGTVTADRRLGVVGPRTAHERIEVSDLRAAWNAPTGG